MSKKVLNLPHHVDIHMTMNDTLYIKVSDDCNWCYSDKTGVFGPPPKEFLAPGFYAATKPPTEYGPYKPQHTGSVQFDATDPGTTCDLKRKGLTPHTITVST